MKVRALLSIFEGDEWHIPGQPSEVFEVSEERYARIKNNVLLLDIPVEVKEPPVTAGSTQLPDGFPNLAQLRKFGYCLEDLLEVEDLTTLKGIGEKSAKTIRKALEELG
jgi:hypothetical protein